MIYVSDVVADVDFEAPQPFTVLRSTGTFENGGFVSTITTQIEATGPVQRATDLEAQMFPEADRIGGVMAFWWTQPIFTTRGAAPVPSTHAEVPQGTTPGTVFTISSAPPAGKLDLFKNGSLLAVGTDYELSGTTITMAVEIISTDTLCVTWPMTAWIGQAAADILVYQGLRYRILSVRHYPGSGFFKAYGTRESAI